MRAASIKVGDLVRGDRFYGLVTEPMAMNEVLRRRVLTVSSLTGRPIPTRFLSANQVIAHWRRAAGSRD